MTVAHFIAYFDLNKLKLIYANVLKASES